MSEMRQHVEPISVRQTQRTFDVETVKTATVRV